MREDFHKKARFLKANHCEEQLKLRKTPRGQREVPSQEDLALFQASLAGPARRVGSYPVRSYLIGN
jgi:hypothetical protein